MAEVGGGEWVWLDLVRDDSLVLVHLLHRKVPVRMMDNETWAIRCLEVATAELARQKGSGFPAWVKRVSWAASGIYLGLTRAAIKEAQHEPSFSLSGF